MFDYLAIGHVSLDVTPAGLILGGTVSYAGRVAQALGCRTAILSSVGADFDVAGALPELTVAVVPAGQTTVFENSYTPAGRQQILHSRATYLTPAHLPVGWDSATIVHLAPIANELSLDWVNGFSNSLIGLTPQGWLRRWDDTGRVYSVAWPEAPQILPFVAAVIVSEEDLSDQQNQLSFYCQLAKLLVLTQGPAGCTLFFQGESYQIPAPTVNEVEPTGAGDVFAAAFLCRLHQTAGNPWEAARYANEMAAQSVTRPGLNAKIALLEQLVSDLL